MLNCIISRTFGYLDHLILHKLTFRPKVYRPVYAKLYSYRELYSVTFKSFYGYNQFVD